MVLTDRGEPVGLSEINEVRTAGAIVKFTVAPTESMLPIESAIARIERDVIDGLPREVRAFEPPALTRRTASEDVHALLGPEKHRNTARHR